MNILSVDRISKEIAHKQLFTDISFGIDDQDKIGLIGDNGCGKSTLLKVISGEMSSDSGSVSYRKNVHIAFAKQDVPFDPEHTVLEHLFACDDPVLQLIRRYEGVLEQLDSADDSDSSDALLKELTDCTGEMDRLDAWNRESEIKSILQELGITQFSAKMGSLSGGMRKKVFLAAALVQDADLLILDEPTNHLDVETIIWLERYLIKTKKAVLLVTHDRYFLERVCNGIIELDDGILYRHQGGYSTYLQAREQRISDAQKTQEKITNILRKENDWLSRQPKARGGKDRGRIQRIQDMQAKLAGPAAERAEYSVSGRRLGKKILELSDVSFSYPDQEKAIISSFSREFPGNSRIAVAGNNGSGKSTLLKLLCGRLQPSEGKVDTGVHTAFAVFDQHISELDGNAQLLPLLRERADEIKGHNGHSVSAAKYLELFGFEKEKHYTPINKLSGGETRRLQLVLTLLEDPNFLILDEPTNDLDIKNLQNLEEFLETFPGCLVVVSHDRYFLDRVCDSLLVLEGDGLVRNFAGSFSDYLEYKEFRAEEEAIERQQEKQRKQEVATTLPPNSGPQAGRSSTANSAKNKKLSYKEQREFEGLEDEIMELEEQVDALEQQFSSADFNPADSESLSRQYENTKHQLEQKMQRWEELAERA